VRQRNFYGRRSTQGIVGASMDTGRRWTLTAVPQELQVSLRPLLWTRIGAWLEERRYMGPAIWSIILLFCALSILEPGSQTVEAWADSADGGRKVLKVQQAGPFLQMALDVSALLFFFLLGHRVNRQLFLKAVVTFESLAISASFAMAHFAYAVKMYTTFRRSYDVGWQVLDTSDYLLVRLPLGLLIGSTDSWRLRQRSKAVVLTVVMAYFLFSWFATKWLWRSEGWLKERTCPTEVVCLGGHTGPWGLYITTQLHIAFFTAKALYGYVVLGQPFAFLKPQYQDRKRRNMHAAVAAAMAICDPARSKANAPFDCASEAKDMLGINARSVHDAPAIPNTAGDEGQADDRSECSGPRPPG